MNMNKIENLYYIAKNIGLKKTDLDNVLNNEKNYSENIHLSAGPPAYHGGTWYGTISIRDF